MAYTALTLGLHPSDSVLHKPYSTDCHAISITCRAVAVALKKLHDFVDAVIPTLRWESLLWLSLNCEYR